MTPSPDQPCTQGVNPWHITAKRLSSGWWHIRGDGPCNWAQPPIWPCDEETLRQHAFPEASEGFLLAALVLAEEGQA